MGIVLSHPFAKDANGWGTEHFQNILILNTVRLPAARHNGERSKLILRAEAAVTAARIGKIHA